MALLDDPRSPSRATRWPSASDDALVRGVVHHADGAFDEIFARYHAPLVRYCRGILLDDDLAQDAAQNALTSALRALRGGRSTPHVLGPWLYRIAQREAVDLARRRRADVARRHSAADGEDTLLSVAAPCDEPTRDRLRELLGDLARLPLRQRSALILRELSGLSYADIAITLETSPAAARQSVLEARGALAEAGTGRATSCADVRGLMDGGDGRRVRGRRVRAHLADCAACRGYAERIDDRRRDLALLFPLAPVALASGGGALAAITGGSAAAGGVAAGGAAAGGWLGLGSLGGATVAKCAIACTALVVGGGALAETVVTHPPARHPRVHVIAQVPQPSTAVPVSASATAQPTPAPKARRAVARPRVARTAPARPRHAATHATSVPRQASSALPARAPTPSATTSTPAPAPAPAATTAAPATTPAPAPHPAATPTTGAKSSSGQLAAAIQQQVQQAIAKATTPSTATSQTVQQAVQQTVAQTLAQASATTQQVLAATRQTVQQLTTTALDALRTQLAGLQQRLFPTSQP
ncbi:sigma-70 family RNA polymerase sigma factor [Paraconexibacter antarcticus]|uniref:Sigma-70 family RNA polymerase sigma factor n=1 Tax=Paraconexibacter antarcticus TaxID=2949664 RepID=A0ABY5DQG8_9ACTN|nr:sigma-70 family RNA polymerase sigma factor [Paraconexibacter antarcticus]UTI64263.1 sigma-70 family RNA polymerase sigma factor [Paraconexibacter antarcticus]